MPIQDYCPYCNMMVTVPDGVSEFTCPHCNTVLEFDLGDEPQPEQTPEPEPEPEPAPERKKRSGATRRTTTGSKKIRLGRPKDKKVRNTPSDSSTRIHLTPDPKADTKTPSRPTERQEVLFGKGKTGPITRTNKVTPQPVLNFIDEDEKKRTDTGKMTPMLGVIPNTPSTSRQVDTSNIKIAKPVSIDSVTGLLATQTGAQPTVSPDAKTEEVSDVMKIVGSSTEFKIEKDGSIPSRTRDVDATEETAIDMHALIEDTKNKAVEDARKAAEEELRRVTEIARQDAEHARREFEEAKRMADEERRRLDEMKLQVERDKAQHAQEEMRRMADEAKKQAEAFRYEQAKEAAKRKAKENAKQTLIKDAAVKRAKEQALAKAKERLIEEKKKQLMEAARQKMAQQSSVAKPENPKTNEMPKTSATADDERPLLKKKKKKRPVGMKGGRIDLGRKTSKKQSGDNE